MLLAAAMTRTPVGRRVVGRLSGVRIARRWTNAQPPLALAPQLRVPVAFVHGREDKFIDVRDAALLFNASPEPRHLTIVSEMGHAFGDAAIERICNAVTWTLEAPLPAAAG